MPFFETVATPRHTEPTADDLALASDLREAVYRKLGTGRRVNLRQWANYFRLLRETDKAPPAELAAVVAWYQAHIGDPFVPEAYSAEAFRKKYYNIKSAMHRDQRDHPNLEITEEAAQIFRWTRPLGWDDEAGLQQAIQVSLNTVRDWRAKHLDFLKRFAAGGIADIPPKLQPTIRRLADRMAFGVDTGTPYLLNIVPSPSNFVLQWVERMRQRGRNINPIRYAVTPEQWQAAVDRAVSVECFSHWDAYCQLVDNEHQ